MAKETQNLADKYRPLCFDEVVGQSVVLDRVRRDFELRKPAPFYINYGASGCGKTTIARMVALYLNCLTMNVQDAVPAPCLECEECKAILEGNSDLLHEINAADMTGVEDSRKMQIKFHHAVGRNQWRVVILDECHRLSPQAFDVWLKPLEDGMLNTVFFFCTTEFHKIKDTIKSRAKVNHFSQVNSEDMKPMMRAILDNEGIECSEDNLNLILAEANGSVRMAINILSAFTNVGEVDPTLIRQDYSGVNPSAVMHVFNYLLAGKTDTACWQISEWIRKGLNPDQITGLVVEHLGNLLTHYLLKKKGWDEGEIRLVKAQSREFGEELIGYLMEVLVSYRHFIKSGVEFGYSAQVNLLIGLLVYRIKVYQRLGLAATVDTVTTAPKTTKQVTPKTAPKVIPPAEKANEPVVESADKPTEAQCQLLAVKLGGRAQGYNETSGTCIILTGARQIVVGKKPQAGKGFIHVDRVKDALGYDNKNDLIQQHILEELHAG